MLLIQTSLLGQVCTSGYWAIFFVGFLLCGWHVMFATVVVTMVQSFEPNLFSIRSRVAIVYPSPTIKIHVTNHIQSISWSLLPAYWIKINCDGVVA
jgi:hypothetical protein